MEHLKFKVVKTAKLPIDWKIEDMQKFPVHEHTISEQQEIIVSYQYKPTSKFEKDKFVEFMKKYLMKKYSSECVELMFYQSNPIKGYMVSKDEIIKLENNHKP